MATPTPTRIVTDFFTAANRHDTAAFELLSDDIEFESTEPAPDGHRYAGKKDVIDVLGPILTTPGSRFDIEEIVEAGDRVAVRSTYHWSDGHLRSLDLFRTHNGRITQILSYVKG